MNVTPQVQEYIHRAELLHRLKEERTRVHRLCNKLSNLTEEANILARRIDDIASKITELPNL